MNKREISFNESIENMNGIEDLVRLWKCDSLRLFQDRLVLDGEKKWCDDLVDKISNQHSSLESSISYAQDELVKNLNGKLKIFYEEEMNVTLVIFDRETYSSN